VEANKEITTAYQGQSIPGLLFFKDGKKVWSHNGTISYDDLTVALKKFL
jgi:thioredoxin-like negative regulator of GroEL